MFVFFFLCVFARPEYIVKNEFEFWADKTTQPTPPAINRKYIYDDINDMQNVDVRNYVRALMMHGHSTHIPNEKNGRYVSNPTQTLGR